MTMMIISVQRNTMLPIIGHTGSCVLLTGVGDKLARLKALGVRISIDDFGTGYTSFMQPKALPLDEMKLDRAFIENLPQDTESAAIVQAMVQMARGLGLVAVAEGMETEAQWRLLAEQGYDPVQGHAINEPLE